MFKVKVIVNGKVLTVHKTFTRALVAIVKLRNQGVILNTQTVVIKRG